MINLPVSVDKAQLPAAYEGAKSALAKCEHIDECQTWADKAAALASYAKQAKDETLMKHCRRIQSRAIRRAGELLKAIEAKPGRKNRLAHRDNCPDRTTAARQAGLSRYRQQIAVSVASVPETDFEKLVESNAPPNIETLAARRIKRPKSRKLSAEPTTNAGPSVPYGFDPSEAALTAQGWLNRASMAAQYARYAEADSCPSTRKMKTAVRDVIAAWSKVLDSITTTK